MKKYSVSVQLFTEAHVTESLVAKIFGVEHLNLRHRPSEGGILWSVDSELDMEGSLEEQIEDLLKFFGPSEKRDYGNFYLTVGVFHDTVTCTVNLSSKHLIAIIERFPGVVVQVVCYPCDEL